MKPSEFAVTLLLVFSFALGNIYKFSFFSPDVRVSLLDITIFLVSFVFIITRFRHLKSVYLKNKQLLKPLLIFQLVALLSLLFSIFHFGLTIFFIGGLYLVRFVFYSLLFVAVRETFSAKSLKTLLFLLGLTLTVTGISQYIFSPDIRYLAISDWDPHYYRVVGSLLDPGFMGICLLYFLIYLFQNPRKNPKIQTFLVILTYFTFALTYSRSSFMGAFAAVAYYSLQKKSWKSFLIGTLVLALTLLILPRAPGGEGVKLERTSSIKARLINWGNSWAIFTKNPGIGIGFNTYRYAQKEAGFLDSGDWLRSHAGAGADSSLLFILATTGFLGFVSFFFLMKVVWHQSLPNLTLKLSLISLLVHSFFLNSVFYPFVLVWLGLLLAVKPDTKVYKSR